MNGLRGNVPGPIEVEILEGGLAITNMEMAMMMQGTTMPKESARQLRRHRFTYIFTKQRI
jgi:hypothetical protein